MTLSEAVRGARTPEELASVLEEIARRYRVAREEEKKFNAAAHEIADACREALSRLETDVYEWESQGVRYRAKKFIVPRVRVTQRLVDMLTGRGLGDLVRRKVEIDDRGLFREVRRGTVGIEEIRTLSEVSTSERFRLFELKPGKEEEVEE